GSQLGDGTQRRSIGQQRGVVGRGLSLHALGRDLDPACLLEGVEHAQRRALRRPGGPEQRWFDARGRIEERVERCERDCRGPERLLGGRRRSSLSILTASMNSSFLRARVFAACLLAALALPASAAVLLAGYGSAPSEDAARAAARE